MKKHYETHVEDTDKLISVAGPVLDYKSWYEQYRKLMEEQAQRKYGLYTPTSEGDEDDFPSIPGMIARYSALGLTNEQMKENPVWVDKTGNGHGLQMKNLAWGGMSGVGGYEMNFNSWTNNVPSISDISMSKTTSSVSVSVGNSAYNNNLIYIHKNNWDVNKNHWLKVASTYEDGDLAFIFYNDKNTKKIELPANGYVNIPAYPEFKGSYMYISTTSNKQGSFTIEQLPLYPGFILGDGVDDFAVTEKELNFEDTYTVYTAFIPFQNDPANNMVLCGKNHLKDFYITYSDLNRITFYSAEKLVFESLSKGFNILCCKRTPDKMVIKNLITDKSSEILANDLIDNPGLYYLWKGAVFANYAKAAIAGQTICNGYFSTDEDDEKVLDWYKKQYPWLFPDQAWTVVGKTNEDEDRATIANITGNGNDLVLSNFGFAEGSGYNEEGEYAGYLVTDGVDDKIISSIFKMGNDWTVIGDWELINTGKNDNAGIVKFDSIVIYNYNYNSMLINIKNGRNILIPDQNTVNAICSDGRIYSKDWKESIYNEETESTSKNFLTIGYSGNAYTKIAFKNLAIYPTVLSREDCIKAYNYLQTLKAK